MRGHLHSPSFLKPVPDHCQKAKGARTTKLHGYFHSYPVIVRILIMKLSKCKGKSFARTTGACLPNSCKHTHKKLQAGLNNLP